MKFNSLISPWIMLKILLALSNLFRVAHSIIEDLVLDSTGRSELSRNITRILNDLVHKEKYDKRLRPNYGGPPVEVGITIFVSSISAVSEVEMDYTVDFYLRQHWRDPRLQFRLIRVSQLTVGWEYVKDIWLPDTFFPNEKKSDFHTATTHNSFLRISDTGEILTSHRLTVTAACPMDLHLFPLDSQECTLEIESYGYSEDDIKYSWLPPRADTFKLHKDVRLPQFEVDHFTVVNKTQVLSTGSYSRLAVKLLFVRNIGFYMMQIYLPSMLIVIISWVSFWIHRDASPARVALGVTTVLTMTTLMSTTNASLPKVSYIKAIDIYLGMSFVMVFASLIEYAAVSYLNKKMKMKRERKKQAKPTQDFKMQAAPPKADAPVSCPTLPGATFYPYLSPAVANADLQRLLPPAPPAPILNVADAGPFFHSLECDCDLSSAAAHAVPLKVAGASLAAGRFGSNVNVAIGRRRVVGVTPSCIDKYSRFVFPLIFFLFNVLYWTTCYLVSRQSMADLLQTYEQH